jgi:hypothetical protein
MKDPTWTLSEVPTVQEVEAAKMARTLYSQYRSKMDASIALANVDSTVMSLRSQKLNRQATPSAS